MSGRAGTGTRSGRARFTLRNLSNKEMLAFYAERLDAVEINNTFYRLPKVEVIESWAGQVPDGFRFSIKASRRITHFTRLKESATDPTEYLLSALGALGQRLGVVLFQLPPNFKVDVERLVAFLGVLPEGTPAAFEFRHESWNDPAVHDALRSRGMAVVCADTDDSDEDQPVVSTGDWGYLRLRRPGYEDSDLALWSEQVKAQGWTRAFVFFKHEDAGAGPAMAARFRAIFEAGV